MYMHNTFNSNDTKAYDAASCQAIERRGGVLQHTTREGWRLRDLAYLVAWRESRPRLVGAAVVLLGARVLHVVVEADDLALLQLLHRRPEAQLKPYSRRVRHYMSLQRVGDVIRHQCVKYNACETVFDMSLDVVMWTVNSHHRAAM